MPATSGYYLQSYAYGPGNTLLSSQSFPGPGPYGVGQTDVITAGSPISYLLLTSHPGGDPTYFGNFSIDDLTFSGSSPAPGSAPGTGFVGLVALMLAGVVARARGVLA